MTTRRLAALIALAAGAFALTPAPAQGVEHERLVVREGSPASATYDPIPQDLPQSAASTPDPSQCRPTTARWCDNIPFTVEVPLGLAPGDDYYLEVTVAWPQDGSTLRAWFYDDTQTKTDEDYQAKAPGDDGYTPNETASDYTMIQGSQGQPARMEVVEPRLVNYNLVVLNFNGVNTGYSVEARIVVDEFVPPFESREPPRTATPTPSSGGGIGSSGSSGSSSFGSFSNPTSSASGPAGSDSSSGRAPLSRVSGGVDPLLGAITGSDLEDELAAPPLAFSGATQEAPPAPPSAAVLLVWLLAVPAAAACGGAGYLLRRRRAAFSFA